MNPTVLDDLASWCLDVAAGAFTTGDPPTLIEGALPAPSARRIHFGRGDGGEIEWDHCCSVTGSAVPGQIVAAVGTIQPTRRWPTPDNEFIRHSKAWRVPLTIEVVRCMPTADGKGRRDWDKLQTDAEHRLHDGWLLLCAFKSALSSSQGYQASMTGMYSVEKDGCKAVRLGLIFQIGTGQTS